MGVDPSLNSSLAIAWENIGLAVILMDSVPPDREIFPETSAR